MASNVLTIYETELNLKKNINMFAIEKSMNKKLTTSALFKEIKRSKPLQEERNITNIQTALHNIRRLCDDAYYLCQKIDFDEIMYDPIDDELLDFIDLTNEMYPCITKELHQKIKMIKTKN
jgi:hypothetical protein